MKQYRANKSLFIMSVLSMVIMLIGGTFSYFSLSNGSDDNALLAEAYELNIELDITPKYTSHKLIPTNDEEIMLAYERECVDIYNYGACQAYDITVSNFGSVQDLIGTIDFTVEGIENLSYMLLEEKDEEEIVYLDKVSVKGDTKKMPLGKHFILDEPKTELPTSKKFVLIIWLTNLDEPQEDYDAGGNFLASVTYEAVSGSKLTGTINGYGEENGEVSKLWGE